jgi:hypothetical protein
LAIQKGPNKWRLVQDKIDKISSPLCLETPVLGKVEQANGLLKHHLTKLAQETHFPWPKLLPLAFLHLSNTLGKLGITPLQSLYGCPFLTSDLILDGETVRLTSHITQLAKFQQILTELYQGISHAPSSSPPTFCPGDLVLIKILHVFRKLSDLLGGAIPCNSFHPNKSPSGWTGIMGPHLQSQVLESLKRLFS